MDSASLRKKSEETQKNSKNPISSGRVLRKDTKDAQKNNSKDFNPTMSNNMADDPKHNPSGKRFFTVQEDYTLFSIHMNQIGLQTTTQICKELSVKLDRTVESIRDRLKRYIVKMSDEDEIRMFEAYQNGKYNNYIHWVQNKEKGIREISEISDKPPG